MRERTLLKIGEFARVGQVSIATLRHYEKEDLLKANTLDPASGYRYYSLDQLPRLNRILALKELGFSLEQIARLLQENLSLEQLRGMLLLKQAQTAQMIEREQVRLAQIVARMRQIEQEGKMPAYELLLKQVDALRVATLCERVALGENLWRSYGEVTAYLDRQGQQQVGPEMLLMHSRYKIYDDGMAIDVEMAVPLAGDVSDDEQIHMRTLSGGLVASTVHTGDGSVLGQAFAALYSWMRENGYRVIGYPRLVRLQYGEQEGFELPVTEVQFPVGKA